MKFATSRVAAGVLFNDGDGRVLLVNPTYKRGWEIPGGYVEISESPRAAAIREVKEELDLEIDVRNLLILDWAPHPNEGDKLLTILTVDSSTRPLWTRSTSPTANFPPPSSSIQMS